jgi:murein DD-endopeptidase MepM/ murein hydrolase activator NlpD
MAGLIRPISGHHLTQGFNGRHPFEPAGFLASDNRGPRRARRREFLNGVPFNHLHGAIDIGCPIGTKIVAPEAGRIVRIDRFPTDELFLMLQIRPGTILFFTHLDSASVQKGDDVVQGQEIARSGNSGKLSTGAHLHWEVRVTTRSNPDFNRSNRWFKWNPRRLRVGHDLAELQAIIPLHGSPAPVADVIDTDPDPLVDPDPAVDEPDAFGDAALLLGSGQPAVDVPAADLDLDPADDLDA